MHFLWNIFLAEFPWFRTDIDGFVKQSFLWNATQLEESKTQTSVCDNVNATRTVKSLRHLIYYFGSSGLFLQEEKGPGEVLSMFQSTLCFPYAPSSLVSQMVKHLPAVQDIRVQSLGYVHPWRREWQPTPVFLPEKSMDRGDWWAIQSVGSQWVRHNWVTNTWLPTTLKILANLGTRYGPLFIYF